MGKVLRAASDLSGTDALIWYDTGSLVDELWLTYDVLFPTATVAASGASGAYLGIFGSYLKNLGGDPETDGVVGRLFLQVPPASVGYYARVTSNVLVTTAHREVDTWHTISTHWIADHALGPHGGMGVQIDGADYGVQNPNGLTNQVNGGVWGLYGPDNITDPIYLRNFKIGTTGYGSSDLFSDDLSSGDFSAFTGTFGDVSVVDDPFPPPPLPSFPSGVYIAFGDPTFTETPNYQGVVGVQAWNTDRGRQYELDKTQAGTGTVTVIDQDGTYDPTNPASPWFGQIGPLVPAQIRSVNPVTGVTEPVFTGFVESWDYVLDITERWYILTINLTDGFEPLARAETVPDSTGTTILLADLVDDRIQGVLADFGWPPDKELVFSGNVHLQETVYNPQTSLLSVLQDCADAELPNAANIYMDKWGQVAFRGRFARLIPAFYSPRIGGMTPPSVGGHDATSFWEVGDRSAAETFGIAPIAAVEWTLDLKNVINAVVCTPNGIGQAQIQDQLVENAASIAQYGTRVLSISDLLTLDQVADPAQGQLALDANDTCMIFGQYYVDNYSQPVEMISHIEFHTRGISDSLAAPLWAFICGVEIGDVVKVWTTNPGGGGFKETEFFVEGIHHAVAPLEGGVFDWTMTLDLSPRAWYSVFNGITYYVPPAPPPGLVAAFNATPVIGPAPLSVSFNSSPSEAGISGPITAYHWDFGDTNTSSSANPSHTYSAASTYTVTLTVTGTSPDGTAPRSQTVTVR